MAGNSLGQGFAAEHTNLQVAEGGGHRFIDKQHAHHEGSALEVGDVVALDEVGDGGGCGGTGRWVGAAKQVGEVGEMLQDLVGGNAEINLTGDFINADGFQFFEHGEAFVGGAEEATALVVAFKGEVEEGVHLFGSDFIFVEYITGRSAGGGCFFLEGGEVPGRLFDEEDSTGQIILHRLTHRFFDGGVIGADKGVEHDSDMALPRMTRLLPCLAVNDQFFGYFGRRFGQAGG